MVASVVALVGCSSSGGAGRNVGGGSSPGAPLDLSTAPFDMGASDMRQQPAVDMAMVTYPAGPYGNQTGDTLADFTAAGYRLSRTQTDSSMLTWDTNIKLSDFHANSACKCMVVTIGATWCGACQQEQPTLVSDISSDPNFCVLGILQDGPNQGTPATQTDVDNWTQQFFQNFPVVKGTTTTDNLMQGYGSTIGLPFSLIVNPTTMKVLDSVQGYDSQIHSYATSLCGP
jgi:hypothetical protein